MSTLLNDMTVCICVSGFADVSRLLLSCCSLTSQCHGVTKPALCNEEKREAKKWGQMANTRGGSNRRHNQTQTVFQSSGQSNQAQTPTPFTHMKGVIKVMKGSEVNSPCSYALGANPCFSSLLSLLHQGLILSTLLITPLCLCPVQSHHSVQHLRKWLPTISFLYTAESV